MRAFLVTAVVLLPVVSGHSTASVQEPSAPLNQQGVSEFPRWSPDGRTIAFMSSRDGNFEIYVMAADGSHQRRLTNNTYNDLFPSWDPDGPRIAYSSTATGATTSLPSQSAIFVIDTLGQNADRLTNRRVGYDAPVPLYNDSYPVWSPDGARIAFLSDRAGGWREIFLLEVETGDIVQVTFHDTHHWNLVWTPDSERILFDTRLDRFPNPSGNPAWGIYSIRVSGSRYTWGDGLRPFKNELDHTLEWDAVLSPDGRMVGFHAAEIDPERRTGLRGMRYAPVDRSDGWPHVAEGTGEARSVEDEYWADWSPDGSQIAFTSTRDGHAEVYVMNADGSGVRRLTISRSTTPQRIR